MVKVPSEEIYRGDLTYYDGGIWICASKATNTFSNMEDNQKKQINDEQITKLTKLELIPVKWEVIENKVYLEGR